MLSSFKWFLCSSTMSSIIYLFSRPYRLGFKFLFLAYLFYFFFSYKKTSNQYSFGNVQYPYPCITCFLEKKKKKNKKQKTKKNFFQIERFAYDNLVSYRQVLSHLCIYFRMQWLTSIIPNPTYFFLKCTESLSISLCLSHTWSDKIPHVWYVGTSYQSICENPKTTI